MSDLQQLGLARLEHLLRYCGVDTDSVNTNIKNGIEYEKAVILKEIIALVREHDGEKLNDVIGKVQILAKEAEKQRCIDIAKDQRLNCPSTNKLTSSYQYQKGVNTVIKAL